MAARGRALGLFCALWNPVVGWDRWSDLPRRGCGGMHVREGRLGFIVKRYFGSSARGILVSTNFYQGIDRGTAGVAAAVRGLLISLLSTGAWEAR
jgi:hypothetical protein